MNTLYQWWAATMGWDGTRDLALIIAAGIGIALCSWSLGADHARRASLRDRRKHWLNQPIIK